MDYDFSIWIRNDVVAVGSINQSINLIWSAGQDWCASCQRHNWMRVQACVSTYSVPLLFLAVATGSLVRRFGATRASINYPEHNTWDLRNSRLAFCISSSIYHRSTTLPIVFLLRPQSDPEPMQRQASPRLRSLTNRISSAISFLSSHTHPNKWNLNLLFLLSSITFLHR